MASSTGYLWNCGTSTTASTCWSNWCKNDETSCEYSTGSATTTMVWRGWVQTTIGGKRLVDVPGYQLPQLTAEQKAEQQRQREAAAAQRLEDEKQRRIAAEKAVTLLKSLLTPEQLAEYEKKKRFFVIGSDGNRYEVDCSQSHRNVYEVDDKGKRKRGYCANATGNVPVADNHATQKLAIETDVAAFKKVANSFAVAS